MNATDPASSRTAGLSLVEMLVVLLILAAISAIAAPGLRRTSSQHAVERISTEIAAALRMTRSRAIQENRVLVFDLDLAALRYGVDGEPPAKLDERVTIAVTAVRASGGPRAVSIVFFPDGTSSGGAIRVAQDGREATIKVDWLSGRIGVDR